MTQSQDTRESLLIAMRDPGNTTAWKEFSAIYRPMINRIARRMGLQASDAEDAAQQVMLTVSQAINNWSKDEAKGCFRSWLTVVVKNAVRNSITRKPRDQASGGEHAQAALHDIAIHDDELERQVEDEYRRSVFRAAAIRVRPEFAVTSWQAFWSTSVDGMSVVDVSAELHMSSGAIYAARSRIMRRLQQVTQEILDLEEPW